MLTLPLQFTVVASAKLGPKKAETDQPMNKYGIAVAIVAGVTLAACGNKEGELMARELRERDVRAISPCQEYAKS
ncbi:hypothetical protein WM32_25720 [Burkholderia ubonensis]|nr:hypothetical protein WM32_25720 [Burkholderia ubonensis]